MKKNYLLFFVPIIFAACQSKPAADIAVTKKDTLTYPFGVKTPDQWDMNHDTKNSLLALNLLKAFESNDTAKLRNYFADSVELWYDGGQFNGKVGQLNKMVKEEFAPYSEVKLRIVDVESVKGKKTPNDEWVSIWYIQKTKDKTGKADSVALVNDMLIKNNRVTKLHEYARHFSMKK
ncbi:nuclear transport factor 2 family protein [Mucilaginibacter sp. RB4R14]|uniref:nuclear transport factor 2 family protein n=1 Tax=Mucilaginibacter aurantiaciroseus TaxID=2949308 RepID=UPI0020901DFC|nr:nuclear transport factor 2 family protein [Mucilaginibacter aurantiaciroseus]MCO5933968.1 nuclear transport factor 2 family protein [Mucilaginibacter aurantiaciroseus]